MKLFGSFRPILNYLRLIMFNLVVVKIGGPKPLQASSTVQITRQHSTVLIIKCCTYIIG